ncbi:hypothetical protein JCM11251_006917 [Rhodosporidiobolus azoricus]
MTTLKSALRFPERPPPPPPPPSREYPVLTSRFSAETLVIKSPPRAAIQRMFSSNSPPASPRSRSPSQGGYKPGHSATASESRINISSPTSIAPPLGRVSLDDERRYHRPMRPPTPTRSRSRTRARTPSGNAATRARTPSGNAADKLADAAHEVIAKLTLRRHGRQPSSGSERSMESLASPITGRKSSDSTRSDKRRSRYSRSLSTPSPVPAEVAVSAQIPSHRPPPRPQTPPFKLTDLPPRSDSRNAIVAQSVDATSFSKPPTRRVPPPPLALPIAPRQRLQALAASRPRPRMPAAARPRPKEPPTPSVKPLRPARLPPPPPVPAVALHEMAVPRAFHAFVTKGFSATAVPEKGHDQLLIKLDVGGQATYTTSVSTLLQDGGAGGCLGDFVEGALRDALAADEAEVEDEAAAMKPRQSLLDLPIPVPLLDINDDDLDGSSSISITAPSFAPSPCPQSPFPFAGYASESSSPTDERAEDPMSPVDPYVVASSSRATNLFLALPPSFAAPPPALPSPPRKEVQQPKVAAHATHLVPSPTHSSGGKHKSAHPDFGSIELPPSPPASLPSLPGSSAPSPPLAHGTAEAAARRALAARVQHAHLSTASTASSLSFSHDPSIDDDDAEDDSAAALLQPFFSVMRHQLYTNSHLSPSSPITAAAFSALERQSLDYGLLPSDVVLEAEYESEEDRSRSTVLGVPRGMSVDEVGCTPKLDFEIEDGKELELPSRGDEGNAEVVEKVEEDLARGRTPSLTLSATTCPTQDEVNDHVDLSTSIPPTAPSPASPTLSDCTIHLFLDRTDSPLASCLSPFIPYSMDTPPPSALTIYSAILTYLRSGSLPPALVLPRFSSSSTQINLDPKHPDVDPLTLSILRIAPAPLLALVSGLRTLEEEARWLGMSRLEVACQAEVARVGSVVNWLSQPTPEVAIGGKKQGRSREASREEALQAKWI